MFNNISWQGYWITLALISAGYYLAIYLLYYRNDFKIILPKSKPQDHSGNSSLSFPSMEKPTLQPTLFEENEHVSHPADNEDHLVSSLMDELTAYFKEAKKVKCIKEEAIYALQRILSKFPAVKNSIYKESLTNVIVTDAELHCSIHLSADDMVKVWLDA
jgi:hypothetical protein